MFAIVRTGGKQYRVAPGDKIVVEKLSGEAGDNVELADVLLAGDGGDLKSTSGLTVAARIVAQAKADKVTVFKKKRRHNYRRKRGHRQLHTILEIVSIGGKGAAKKASAEAKPAVKADAAPAKVEKPAAKPEKPAAKAEKPAAKAEKPATKAKSSTKDAAPAKAAPKKAASKAAAKKK